MGDLGYPNRDWLQQQYSQRLTDALDAITAGVNTVGAKTGATPVGVTDPPPPVAALKMSAADGIVQAVIEDHGPVRWGIHYFLEYSDTEDFSQPHVIHLGVSRTWRGSIGNLSTHWRAYSMNPGQMSESKKVYHKGVVVPGTPSATARVGSGATIGGPGTVSLTGGVAQISAVAPLSTGATAITSKGTVRLQNSAGADVTAAYGTDTAYFTASGGPATSGHVITGDTHGGIQDSGTALSALVPVYAHTAFTSPAGAFTVAHGLGYSPSFATIAITTDGVTPVQLVVWQTALRWDATNFYLYGAVGSVTGFVDSVK